jgi:hypothetical protein
MSDSEVALVTGLVPVLLGCVAAGFGASPCARPGAAHVVAAAIKAALKHKRSAQWPRE